MSAPNTTQIPNEIFDVLLKEMSDTDLRIVLIVARKTLGWIMDYQTGMRQEKDYLSHYKLSKIIGRGNKALSRSLQKCCRKGWIEVRNNKGQILTRASERSGQKLYYRLGPIILPVNPEKSPVDNFSDLCHKDTGITESCQDQCHKDTGSEDSLYVRARVIRNINYNDIVNNESKRNLKNSHLSKKSNDFEKLVNQCQYLSEKMREPKYLGLYIKIAKQIGVGQLERAIGLAREDDRIKNKGAYMVKICKTYGYKSK